MSNFINALQNHRGGETLSELDREMVKVVEAVRATGKAGEITLKISVKRMKGAAPHVLIFADDVKAKIPKQDRDASIFFSDDDSRLHRSDPNQRRLPLGEVEGEFRQAG